MPTSMALAISLAAVFCAIGRSFANDVPGIMKLPLSRITRNDTLDKRQIGTNLDNPRYGTLYIVDIEIGTPPQPISVQIDTGSSDLWVDPDCSTSGQVVFCQSYPTYDPNLSSTAQDTGYPMDLSYGKGSCSGEYLTDTVLVGGKTIINQQFGWATQSTSLPTGIMGIGPGVELIGYYNIIDQLYLQKVTQSRAFSLDLGSVDTAEGSIIFGGVDTKKYSGPLEKRPIIPYYDAPDGFDRYWIYMTSVGITKPGAATKIYTTPTYNQAVFLDSGGTLSRLPANLVAAMLSDFTGVVNQGNGLYTVDCSYTTSNGTFEFGFGNTVIHVPFHQFIWVAGPGTCVFGAVANAAGDVDWVLGDTFLRSAYVVYDQDNQNLLLANAANCGTNLVAIGSGVNAVPSITGACPAVATSSSTSTTTAYSTVTASSVTSKTTTTSSTTSKSTTSTTASSSKSTSTTSSKSSSSTKTTTVSSTSTTKTSTSSTITSKPTSSSSTKPSTLTTLTTITSFTSKTTSATSKTSTATLTLGYTYVGCFVDSKSHALTRILANDSMSVETCLSVAHAANPPYVYAGVEYGRECWAAVTSPAAATPTSGTKACTMTCVGNSKESCGGKGMFNLYYSAPTATTTAG